MQNSTTFVLWGDQFEERLAVNLVATLREEGLMTTIVGVTARCCVGRQGITIHPDLTLSDALDYADRINCVVLPCTTAALVSVDTDPRLHRLLRIAVQGKARLLVHQPRTIIETSLRDIAHLAREIIYYANYNSTCIASSLVEKLKMDYTLIR